MELEKILENLKIDLKGVNTEHELSEVKTKYLGKKGSITSLSSKIKDLSNEEKKTFGASLNKVKTEATNLINDKKEEIDTNLLNEKLKTKV